VDASGLRANLKANIDLFLLYQAGTSARLHRAEVFERTKLQRCKITSICFKALGSTVMVFAESQLAVFMVINPCSFVLIAPV